MYSQTSVIPSTNRDCLCWSRDAPERLESSAQAHRSRTAEDVIVRFWWSFCLVCRVCSSSGKIKIRKISIHLEIIFRLFDITMPLYGILPSALIPSAVDVGAMAFCALRYTHHGHTMQKYFSETGVLLLRALSKK